jgi:hypothetical protein
MINTGKKQTGKNSGKPKVPDRKPFLLRLPWIPIVVITLLVYGKTLFFDFTRFDDTIFIVENQPFNNSPGSIAASFQRGLFNPANDIYYRPLLMVDFVVESRLFGVDPAWYHFTNLLFHMISVWLLFLFLKRLSIPETDALLLALLFAIHPVLSQAVAWIPGRNDMLLMIFLLGVLLLCDKYLKKPGPGRFIFQFVLLLLALFTKETAVIIPVATLALFLFVFRIPWKKLALLSGSWVVAIAFWTLVRSQATLAFSKSGTSELFRAGIDRLPAIVQYLGKIFFPFNLSVFPMIENITILWGILAVIVLIALVVISRSYKKPLTWFGLFWFLIFLAPVLIVPKSLNDQVFEHRLYIPLAGILMILSQTVVCSAKLSPRYKTAGFGAVILLFAILSFFRVDSFKDPFTFWEKAAGDAPNSSYTKMLYGLKIEDKERQKKILLEAYALNPAEKHIGYYLGKIFMEQKDYPKADSFLKNETIQPYPQYPDTWFTRADIAYKVNQPDSALAYLRETLRLDPLHEQANFNLVLLLLKLNRPGEARQVANEMKLKGMDVTQVEGMMRQEGI